MRRFLILYNPSAGQRKSKNRIARLTECLTEAGFEWTLDESLYHKYYTEKYKGLDLPYTDIICCGGDGTLHEIVNIFWKQDVTISIYPIGSGNDFYLKAGGKLDSEALIDRIINNDCRTIDVATINEHIFINNAGIGLDAETLKISDKLKKYHIKRAGYKLAAAIEIMVYQPITGRFIIDGVESEREFMIATICNGAYFGGGMMISPNSILDDGVLELVLLRPTGRLQLINLFSKIFKGEHVGHPNVDIISAKEIEIYTEEPQSYHCEGELIGTTPLKIAVVEKSLRIIT